MKNIDKETRDMAEVSDALKKEGASQPKDKTHYKIYRVEVDEKTGKKKHITMTKFWAKDDDEAYAELKKYQKVANKAYTYYYSTTGYYVGNELDKDGKVKRFDSMREMMEDWHSRESTFTKVKDAVLWPFERAWDRAKDFFWYGAKDLLFWLKHHHNRSESWSLDYHLVEDLIFNIPRLIKDKSGVPTSFCYRARKELHKDDSSFDADKSFEENPNSDSKEMELATKLWNEELEKCLLYAKLWDFYHNFGITEDEEFEKTWKKTIPYKPGTCEEIDYLKLQELENRNWNSLWNWIKEYGRNLWD